jgi:aryl-alcohol dehydrogenase-like predicted oxidoreductase
MTQLGRTGLEVSPIGLGLAALGRPGYLNLGHGEDLGSERSVQAMERHAHGVLDAALAGGIRYFDAARSYGEAEAFLASWLRQRGIAPGEVVVGSKWGYTYTAGWRVDADPPEVKDLSVGAYRRQVAETRALLGDWLSLYQIHSATIDSGALDAELLGELRALREEGVAIGLTATGPQQANTIDAAIATVQATWNLIERSAGPALQRAHDAGLGVIVKEAVANGRLTARGAPDALMRAAQALGATPDAVALAAVLRQPWSDVVLSGATTEQQVQSNLAALRVGTVPELDELIEAPEAYWAERSALRWT